MSGASMFPYFQGAEGGANARALIARLQRALDQADKDLQQLENLEVEIDHLPEDADPTVEVIETPEGMKWILGIPAGKTGMQGIQGVPGVAGLQGVPGPQGIPGLEGRRGPAGPQGERGERGDAGSVGPAGPQGIQGERGQRGEQGVPGPQGIPGMDGKDYVLTDRDKETISAMAASAIAYVQAEEPPEDAPENSIWIDTDEEAVYIPRAEGVGF